MDGVQVSVHDDDVQRQNQTSTGIQMSILLSPSLLNFTYVVTIKSEVRKFIKICYCFELNLYELSQ